MFNGGFVHKFNEAADVGNKKQATIIHEYIFCKITTAECLLSRIL